MKKEESRERRRSRECLKISSPAKVNLHLEIGAQRTDGFHELRSLFAMIDLQDELTLETVEGREGECDIFGPFDFPRESNLIWRAYRAFVNETGFDEGTRIHVEKRIPAQAGLGGGSSNAAAALKLLERRAGIELDGETERRIAASLGSDVPFFLDGPCAVAEGRGEKLRRVEVREDFNRFTLLLVSPEVKVSTGDAYARLDRWYALRPEDEIRSSLGCETIEEQYRSMSPGKWDFYNSFTPVLVDSYPVYRRLFDIMEESRACFSEISGSGSTLFSLFESEEEAEKALKSVSALGIEGRKVKMLASCPEAVYNT